VYVAEKDFRRCGSMHIRPVIVLLGMARSLQNGQGDDKENSVYGGHVSITA